MITIRIRRLIEIVIEVLLVVAVIYLGWEYKGARKVVTIKNSLEAGKVAQTKAIENFVLDLKGVEDMDGLDKILRKYRVK